MPLSRNQTRLRPDLVAGANVLLDVVRRLAGAEGVP